MEYFEALRIFGVGAAFIIGAIALIWEPWVVYRGEPQDAPLGTFGWNVVVGPFMAAGGVVLIIWSFVLQPVVATFACVVTVSVVLIVLLRRALRHNKARMGDCT